MINVNLKDESQHLRLISKETEMSILFWVFVGYCLATVFPCPWLSTYIINVWKKLLGLAKPVVDAVKPTNDKQ